MEEIQRLFGVMRATGLRKHRYNYFFTSELEAFRTVSYLNELKVNKDLNVCYQIFSISQDRLDSRMQSARRINELYDKSKSGIIAHNLTTYQIFDTFEQFLNTKMLSRQEVTPEM